MPCGWFCKTKYVNAPNCPLCISVSVNYSANTNFLCTFNAFKVWKSAKYIKQFHISKKKRKKSFHFENNINLCLL
jgi:hypothetical protein